VVWGGGSGGGAAFAREREKAPLMVLWTGGGARGPLAVGNGAEVDRGRLITGAEGVCLRSPGIGCPGVLPWIFCRGSLGPGATRGLGEGAGTARMCNCPAVCCGRWCCCCNWSGPVGWRWVGGRGGLASVGIRNWGAKPVFGAERTQLGGFLKLREAGADASGGLARMFFGVGGRDGRLTMAADGAAGEREAAASCECNWLSNAISSSSFSFNMKSYSSSSPSISSGREARREGGVEEVGLATANTFSLSVPEAAVWAPTRHIGDSGMAD